MGTDSTTLGDIGEHATIAIIQEENPSRRNGDDAAVLGQPAPNSRTVVATDLLIEDRHFRWDWSTPRDVGIKAITQNFADIEAMGARPTGVLLGLAAPPETPVSVIRGLARGIHDARTPFTAELMGGDVTSGPALMISITAVGQLGGDRPELRLDAARPGQLVIAHGKIGHSAAGYQLLSRGLSEPAELIRHHLAPTIEPTRGLVARATGATAMTDNSDGLIQDLGLMCARSGVGMDLSSAALHDDLVVQAARATGCDPWELILTGGEDHTLIGTSAECPSGFRVIGHVTKTGGVTVDGQPPAYHKGWTSF